MHFVPTRAPARGVWHVLLLWRAFRSTRVAGCDRWNEMHPRACGFLATDAIARRHWRETHARGRKLATDPRNHGAWRETHTIAPPSMPQFNAQPRRLALPPARALECPTVIPRPPLPPGPFLVVGLARSGVAAALALRARGGEVVACDAAPVSDELRAELAAAGVPVHAPTEGVELVASASTVVKSPGVPHQAAVVADGAAAGPEGRRRARDRVAAARATTSSP